MMVIDLFHKCNSGEQRQVLEILNGDRSDVTPEDIEWTIALMEQYGSIRRAEDACRERAQQAEQILEAIPTSEPRETMREMCSFLVERVF